MANDLDKKSLDDAFGDAVANAYEVMLASYIDAAGDKTKETAADSKFKSAVTVARRVRAQAEKQL